MSKPSQPSRPTASYYNVPGTIFTPTDNATILVNDGFGCIHASAGAGSVLNAPLDIPPGSQIVLMRLYYDDANAGNMRSWITRYNEYGTDYEDLVTVQSSGEAGHGSNFGNLDHVTDTYNWRYVLNVQLDYRILNAASLWHSSHVLRARHLRHFPARYYARYPLTADFP